MAQKPEQTTREDPRPRNDNRARKAAAPPPVPVAAKVATFSENLRETQLSKKAAFGLMLVAAALTMIVGFNWGGWVTGGTSQKNMTTGAEDAVILRLAPICVAQFNLDPQKATKMEALKAIKSSWERPTYIKEQGWATMPGEKEPDGEVANACAKLLMES